MISDGMRGTLGIFVSERKETESGQGTPAAMPEDAFCRRLCLAAEAHGIDAFVFDASSFRTGNEPAFGFRLRREEWRFERITPPDLVYDRSLCKNTAERRRRSAALTALKRRKAFILLGGSLPGKWEVYAALRGDDRLRPYLPATCRLGGGSSLCGLAARHPEGLFLKPSAGMQGRGAVAMSRSGECIAVRGRDRANDRISRDFADWHAAASWLSRFAGRASYIAQPLLKLTGDDGLAFDVRALIQKDERGRWCFTGAAVREGAPGSVTSNLHGGGTAAAADAALARRFGENAAAALLARIRRISERAAARLERLFGRFAELGFDFGIEQDGRLWLLEANAKPGREAFEHDEETRRLAANRPIRYAALLLSRKIPVFRAAFKALSPASHAATRNMLKPESKGDTSRRFIHEFDIVSRTLLAAKR